MAYQFGENIVIWKSFDSWNGFGFFGESRHGKTPLSLAFAKLLIESGSKSSTIVSSWSEES